MSHPMNRREILKLIAAGAASTTLASCASTPEARKPLARVIVIGGGYGGATAARYLRLWGGNHIEVYLIERNTNFIS